MDKEKLFSIGEVARLFDLSVGTLRHYETLGLVQPEYVDPGTGYRYYSVRQFEPLNTVRYLRMLGMPLPAIWLRAADGSFTCLRRFGYEDFKTRLGGLC